MSTATLSFMAIGERVRELRKSRKLTQEQVARAANLGVSHLARIEQGAIADPSWSTVCAIAAALGVSVAKLEDDAAKRGK